MISSSALSQEQSSKKNGAEGEPNAARGLDALNFHEVVVPGVRWYWRLALVQPTPAQIGLILLGLQKMHDSHQGGMSRLGYGRIVIESILMDGEEIWTAGKLAENDRTLAAMSAWADSVDQIGPQAFEDFAASHKVEKAPKKATKAKAGAANGD